MNLTAYYKKKQKPIGIIQLDSSGIIPNSVIPLHFNMPTMELRAEPPRFPVVGQMYHDMNLGHIMVYDGNTWLRM